MKISYKEIRRVTPARVDPYGILSIEDLYDEDQCREMEESWILSVLRRGNAKRVSCPHRAMCANNKLICFHDWIGEQMQTAHDEYMAALNAVGGADSYTKYWHGRYLAYEHASLELCVRTC